MIWPLAGIALTLKQDQHGPPLLVGFALGALVLWLDRRGQAEDRAAVAAGPGPGP